MVHNVLGDTIFRVLLTRWCSQFLVSHNQFLYPTNNNGIYLIIHFVLSYFIFLVFVEMEGTFDSWNRGHKGNQEEKKEN